MDIVGKAIPRRYKHVKTKSNAIWTKEKRLILNLNKVFVVLSDTHVATERKNLGYEGQTL